MKTKRKLAALLWLIACALLVFPAGPGLYAQGNSGAVISAPSVVTIPWSSNTPENITQVTSTVTYDGQPVAGAIVEVNGYTVPQPTADDGTFMFPADHNSVKRYLIHVKDLSGATINGSALTQDQQDALLNATGSIDVHYDLQNIETELQDDGTVKVTGDAVFANGDAPPPVVLYAFRLFGTVTDTNNNPVEGASVSTRAPEARWTLSDPTGPDGRYQDPFWPNSTEGYRVVVIDNDGTVYRAANDSQPSFSPLKSAQLDITLDRSTQTLTFAQPQEVDGIIYQGLLIGVVTEDGQLVKPASVTWPDEHGHFTMVLPASVAGKTVAWWQDFTRYFSTIQAAPGGEIDVNHWPDTLDPLVPYGFAQITLPG
jgi:hypothetical protein